MFATPPLLTIPFPAIDPVLVEFGPIAIRWYALAYIAGLLIGWWIVSRLAEKPLAPGVPSPLTRLMIDDFLLWATLGVILGGRTGYVLFYNFAYYAAHPLHIFTVWQGGMSFHGGLLGVIVAIVLFCRKRGVPILVLGDLIALVAPIGLFFGRIANFINGELYGRPTDVPWAMRFPSELLANPDKREVAVAAAHKIDPHLNNVEAVIAAYRNNPQIHAMLDTILTPRHPSQLYEATLEGIVLFLVLLALARFARARAHPGLLTGVFVMGYGIARIIVEFFRHPDVQIGYLPFHTTMGQWLSLPLVAAGLWLTLWARRRVVVAAPGQGPDSGSIRH